MPKDVEEGTTTGIWIGEGDAELFKRFDEYFERTGRGTYKRGERVKEAMEVYLVVHDVIRNDESLPDPDEMRFRQFCDLVRSELKFDEDV